MAAPSNLPTTQTSPPTKPAVTDKSTQTDPPLPAQGLNNILYLLSLLASSSNTSTAHATSTVHPAIPNPLFTPPASPTHNITIDASTRIIGHCNNVHVPSSQGSIDSVLNSTFAHLPAPQSPFGNAYGGLPTPLSGWGPSPRFDVKVNAGVSICGSRNLVVIGPNGKVAGGLKRKAEVDLQDVPAAKKVVKEEP